MLPWTSSKLLPLHSLCFPFWFYSHPHKPLHRTGLLSKRSNQHKTPQQLLTDQPRGKSCARKPLALSNNVCARELLVLLSNKGHRTPTGCGRVWQAYAAGQLAALVGNECSVGHVIGRTRSCKPPETAAAKTATAVLVSHTHANCSGGYRSTGCHRNLLRLTPGPRLSNSGNSATRRLLVRTGSSCGYPESFTISICSLPETSEVARN